LPEALYHTAARIRRRWFDRHPEARRTLRRPVISVGNLTFGGSGKTPIAGAIARALRDRGERPAILSRGYGRRHPEAGVVLVSDGSRILADVDRAGDEPLMLARALPGVVVAVCADRHLAGRLAELHCGATVHVLDDGFQHLALTRDVDLLVMDGREPTGVPLREDATAARVCDAVLLARGASDETLPPRPVFRWWRELRGPLDIGGAHRPRTYADLGPVLAVAAIAAPLRFFDDLKAAGADVRATMAFGDHHAFTREDVRAMAEKLRVSACTTVVTTEKDAVRLRRFRPLPVPLSMAPMTIVFDPSAGFETWLTDHVAYARTRRPAA
jgi:tetraacyldisaccharide 4'-kinase